MAGNGQTDRATYTQKHNVVSSKKDDEQQAFVNASTY